MTKFYAFKQSIMAIALVLAATGGAHAAEGPCFPGFTGDVRTIVEFHAGSQNAKFPQVVNDHLAFLTSAIKAGKVQFGGPILPFDMKDHPPQGAFLIYNDANLDHVKADIDKDPMVTNQVFTYTLKNWLQCTLAQ